jgi:hypothetical protein
MKYEGRRSNQRRNEERRKEVKTNAVQETKDVKCNVGKKDVKEVK